MSGTRPSRLALAVYCSRSILGRRPKRRRPRWLHSRQRAADAFWPSSRVRTGGRRDRSRGRRRGRDRKHSRQSSHAVLRQVLPAGTGRPCRLHGRAGARSRRCLVSRHAVARCGSGDAQRDGLGGGAGIAHWTWYCPVWYASSCARAPCPAVSRRPDREGAGAAPRTDRRTDGLTDGRPARGLPVCVTV